MPFLYKYKVISVIFITIIITGCAAEAPYLKLEPSLERDVKTFDGSQYTPLVKICDVYGIKWSWDQFAQTVVLEKSGRIILRASSDKCLVNGRMAKLEKPVLLSGGAIFIPVSFVRSGLGYIVQIPSYVEKAPDKQVVTEGSSRAFAIRTIVVDPGHGGKDPGAIGRRTKVKERDINLYLSKKIRDILEGHNIKVVMTREDNAFIPLPKRTAIANRAAADLFVSIHINASRTRSMSGFECYYLSEATDDNARAIEAFENASLKLGGTAEVEHSNVLDKALWDMTLTENRRESASLARHICASVERSGIAKNRGTRTARFYVLKGTRMPAILVESGYISNRDEELKLKDPQYMNKMSEAIAKGILAYKEEYERTEGYTNI